MRPESGHLMDTWYLLCEGLQAESKDISIPQADYQIPDAQSCPLIHCFSIRGWSRLEQKLENLNKQTVRKFQNARQARTGRNMVKSSSPNPPSTWIICLYPRTHASRRMCLLSASSFFPVRISCRVITVFVFRKPLFINKFYRIYVFYTNITLYIVFGIIRRFT
jgi:hypothetical protein